MAKLTLTDLSGGYLAPAAINANHTTLETALENTLSRDGTSPNTMLANLDLNSYKVINHATPTATTDVANKAYVDAVASAFNDGTTLASTLSASSGASLLGFLQAGTGAGGRTLQTKIRETVSVTDFYADGVGTSAVMVDPSGVVDSTLGIQAAFNAVANSGKIVFPSGTYKITDVIQASSSNLDIDGQGSTIDCAYTGQSTESGAFLWLTGNENRVHDLRITSNVSTVDSVNYIDGVLLKLTGNDNLCEHNYFYGGNAGGVRVYGDSNIVRGNTFEKCNNRGGAGDYGSVHIRSGVGNKVIDNDISDFFYSGISAYGDNGSGTNIVTDLTIRGNTIKGTVGTRTYTMGVFILQGANKNLIISDNIISEVGNEGIIVFSAASQTCDGVIIHNNIIRNTDYSGIFVNANTSYASANVSIRGNTIVMSSTVTTAYAIVLEKATDSIIKDNVVINATTISVLMVGILVQTSTLSNNIVAGNVVKNGTTGISFAGLRSLCQGNTVYSATTGFSYSSCESSAIQNNMANTCTTGFSGGSAADYTLMTGNMASGCTTDFTSTTTARNMYGNTQTTEAATTNYVNGTLVSGTDDVTFNHISPGDGFVVFPTTNGGTVGNHGSLYIAYVDATGETITVNSTNAADTRTFTVVKISNAVVAA